jgi:hypothetical protein
MEHLRPRKMGRYFKELILFARIAQTQELFFFFFFYCLLVVVYFFFFFVHFLLGI